MGASPVSARTRPPTNDCGVLRFTHRYNLFQFDQSVMDVGATLGCGPEPKNAL